MNVHFFLLSHPLPAERLSWIEESLKFFFVQLAPETLVHQKAAGTPPFTFFLTGDALYSLQDPETLQIWNIILSFPPVRVVCDRQDLDLRGIAIGPLRMKFPDQIIDTNSPGQGGRPSFWKDLALAARQTKSPLPGTAGWFQTESPYMHRSAENAVCFLSAALDERLSAELYAYLDGVHAGHHGQHPPEDTNIGEGLASLSNRAAAARLGFVALGCSRSAAARGYSTWNDGQGQVISTCTVRAFRIRELGQMIERFLSPHIILSSDAGVIRLMSPGAASYDRAERASKAPPLTILVTQGPYSTGTAFGAISFAVASAHKGILTRVIFIENGIYALTGSHHACEGHSAYTIQEIIDTVAGSENLHFFAFTPSFQKRGVQKDKSLNAVLDIGYPGLGKIFFYSPGNVDAGHQRVLVF